MAKIIHERSKCVGCGACAAVCPKYWEMGGDGKSQLKGATAEGDNFVLTVDSPECCSDAANACPVKCIKVEE
jgi:ferredoxin